MKTLHFGYEAGTLQNSAVEGTFVAPSMRVKGYAITLSMMTSKVQWTYIGQASISVVLFTVRYTPQLPDPSVPLTLTQVGGTNPAGLGGGPTTGNELVTCIMSHTIPGSRNVQLTKSDLDIPIVGGTPIVVHAEHAGYVSDFEVQGVLYYE